MSMPIQSRFNFCAASSAVPQPPERIEHHVAFVGRGGDDAFKPGREVLGGVAEALLGLLLKLDQCPTKCLPMRRRLNSSANCLQSKSALLLWPVINPASSSASNFCWVVPVLKPIIYVVNRLEAPSAG